MALSSTRSVLVLVLLAPVAISCVAAQPLPASHLAADLVLTQPLVAEGLVLVAPPHQWGWFTQPNASTMSNREPVVQARSAEFQIMEATVGLRASAAGAFSPPLQASHSVTHFGREAKVRVTEFSGAGVWSLVGAGADSWMRSTNLATTAAGQNCTINATGRLTLGTDLRPLREAAPVIPWALLTAAAPALAYHEFATLWADCGAARFEAQGDVTAFFMGSTFELEFEDAALGSPRSVIVKTGPDVVRDVDGVERDVIRILTVRSHGASEFLFAAKPGAAIRSSLSGPALSIVGALEVPNATGKLTWGDQTIAGEIRQVKARGQFLVESPMENNARLQGTVRGEPMLASSAAAMPVLESWVFVPTILVVAGAGLLAAALKLRFVAWSLFTRLVTSDSLNHSTRRRIRDFVDQNPGIHVQGLVRALGVPRRVVDYHVLVLRRQGLVTTFKVRNRLTLYTRPPPSTRDAELAVLMRQETAQRIMDAARTHPDWTQREIAAALGISQSYVSRVKRTLGRLRTPAAAPEN